MISSLFDIVAHARAVIVDDECLLSSSSSSSSSLAILDATKHKTFNSINDLCVTC